MPTTPHSVVSAEIQHGTLRLNGRCLSERLRASEVNDLLGEIPRNIVLPRVPLEGETPPWILRLFGVSAPPRPDLHFLLWDAAGITATGHADDNDVILHELIFVLAHHPSERAPRELYRGDLSLFGIARETNEGGWQFTDRVIRARDGSEIRGDNNDQGSWEFWRTNPSTKQQERFGQVLIMRKHATTLSDNGRDDVWLYFTFRRPRSAPNAATIDDSRREAAVRELESKMLELQARKQTLEDQIAHLQQVPLPAAKYFAELTAPGEHRSAKRDYMLFAAGVVASVIVSIILHLFGWA